eukprot:4374539-Pyramimonas_sp.AAC.1
MIRCRRQMGAICGSGKKGRCLTTLLDLRSPQGDPAVYFPRLCCEFWMRQWILRPAIRAGVRRAWPYMLQTFRRVLPQHRSRHVRGPMGAVM